MSAEEYAEQIREAKLSRKPISPISREIGPDNVELAYEIQNINTQLRVNSGSRLVGKKIGLTSFDVQKQLGVDQPDYGVLFHDSEVLNGASLSFSELIQPKAEAEIAFVLEKTLDKPDMTIVDIIKSIEFALPAIEIADSRIEDWNISFSDTIADNASASHYVLGSRPVLLKDFDNVQCRMTLSVNGEVVSTGKGSACLGSPLNATLWLANKMIEIGNPLRRGEVILSGALGRFVDIRPGDYVETSIEGLGKVSLHIVD